MAKRTVLCLVAGLVEPLLWTPLESLLLLLFPLPSSRLVFAAMQACVGFVSALILVLPLALALRPASFRLGVLFVAAFLVSVVVGHIAFGGTYADLLLLFQLPDTWVFLVSSLVFFWWASSRKTVRNAA